MGGKCRTGKWWGSKITLHALCRLIRKTASQTDGTGRSSRNKMNRYQSVYIGVFNTLQCRRNRELYRIVRPCNYKGQQQLPDAQFSFTLRVRPKLAAHAYCSQYLGLGLGLGLGLAHAAAQARCVCLGRTRSVKKICLPDPAVASCYAWLLFTF